MYLVHCVGVYPAHVHTCTYKGSRAAQRSKASHLSARGVTAVPGLNPGCITAGRDLESRRAAHNWPCVVRIWPEQAIIVNQYLFLTYFPH